MGHRDLVGLFGVNGDTGPDMGPCVIVILSVVRVSGDDLPLPSVASVDMARDLRRRPRTSLVANPASLSAKPLVPFLADVVFTNSS